MFPASNSASEFQAASTPSTSNDTFCIDTAKRTLSKMKNSASGPKKAWSPMPDALR
jgi:hypothetical protein